MRVKSYKAKRGGKMVAVKEHTKRPPQGRTIRSSFLEKIVENDTGGYSVIIRGKEYPYPFLPDSRVGGLLKGTNGSPGRYYNKNIKSRYF